MIGTVLMSVLTPAILWNRAHIANRTCIFISSPLNTYALYSHLGRRGTGKHRWAPYTLWPIFEWRSPTKG